MIGTYDVMIGSRKAGSVQVERQGLYYRFACRCSLSGKTVHRLVVICGNNRTDLGICVPVDGRFGVDKRIPCKQFSGEKPEFLLITKEPNPERRFVPVYPEEPFTYMTRLKNAFMEIRDGQAGLVISE